MASNIHCCGSSCQKRISALPDWCNIDIDVFACIQKNMLFDERFLCRAVCKSWRSITETLLTSSSKPHVLLLCKQYFLNNLSDQEDYFETSSGRCLLNLSGKELFKLDTRSSELLSKLRLCVGLSHGWVILLLDRSRFAFSLFNPSLGISISIPFRLCLICFEIRKAVLTADPISGDNNYCIMAIYGNSGRIGFAKCGDPKFRDIMGQVDVMNPRYQDLVCFKNWVYAINDTGIVQAWDCNRLVTIRCSCCRTVRICSPTRVLNLRPSFNQGRELQPGCKLHLVESEGNLLLVSRMRSGTAASFQLYKLDFDEMKWEDMDSLGNRMLFLLVNQSLSLPASSFPKFKRNSIYFEDENGRGPSGLGFFVFSLGSGFAEQVYL